MHKTHRFFLILCLSAAAATPLQGSARNTPATRVAEAYQANTPAATDIDTRPKSSTPQETTAIKVGEEYSPPAQRPVQKPGNHPRPAPVETANRPAAETQRQPAATSRPAGQLQRPSQSATRTTVNNRPASATQRPVENRRRTDSGRTTVVVTTPQRPQPSTRVILSTPRQLPTTPLPATIRLDQRCAPYDFVMLRPYTIAPRGNVVELVDGSVWHVSKKKDRRKVRNWTLWDSIVIESSQFLGWASFSLVNYTRGESVDVTMTLGPVYEGHASHWVTQLDPARRFVVLEDGSRWSFTEASFGDWREDDAVVLGLAKDTSGQYIYMLINTRTMKHSLAINIR